MFGADLFFDFDSRLGVVESGGNVASWTDQVQGYVISEPTTRPGYLATGGPNSLPAVQFVSNEQLLGATTFSDATEDWLIFMVARCAVGASAGPFGPILHDGALNERLYVTNADGGGGVIYGVRGNFAQVAAVAAQAGTFVAGYVGSGAAASNATTIRWGGAQSTNVNSNVALDYSTGRFDIGRAAGSFSSPMSFSRVCVIRGIRDMSSGQRDAINPYLTATYGVTV